MPKDKDDLITRVSDGEPASEVVDSVVVESGLSRCRQHMLSHDTGLITAFRHDIDGEILTREQNLKRNRALLAELRSRYNVTQMKGAYIENYGSPDEKEVGENVFFVVDQSDAGRLEKDLRKLGQKWNQDSVLYVPRGAPEGYLIGTREGGYPGMGRRARLNHPVFGQGGQFMTKVKGRPFILVSEAVEEFLCDYPAGYFGEWGRDTVIRDGKK